MILLLDAGNTRIKWVAVGPEGKRVRGVRGRAEAATLAADWQSLDLDGAVLACVAGADVRGTLEGILQDRQIPGHWLESRHEDHGLLNLYQPPESLGVDRYAALVGAQRNWARDCLVVGVGTALTVDLLGADGQFLGGCIAPGPEMMQEALARGTARLGLVDLDWRDGGDMALPAPRDTVSAIREGILHALLGVVGGMEARLVEWRRIQGGDISPLVVLHGGGSSWLRPFLKGEVRERNDLVLEGLAWIARDLGFAV